MEEPYQARVVLREGMHFEGVARAGEDFAIQLDSAPEFGGMEKGNRPIDLMLVSVAGCTAMDIISILRKKKEQISGLEVRVRADRAEEYPKVYTFIWMDVIVTGRSVDPEAVERSIELSLTKYCPAAAMLQRAGIPIESNYQIIEDA